MNVELDRSSRRIAQLDGWRGISVLFVVGGHLATWHRDVHPDDPSIARVLAYWGVCIFFVISGFIITKLALREYDMSRTFSIRNFWTRRIFRIIPPFFLYLCAVILVATLPLIDQSNSQTLTAATFVCNFPSVKCGWFAAHSWTLAYEEQFYIGFPILFILIGRNPRRYIGALLIFLWSFPFLRFFLHLSDGWRTAAGFAPSFSLICAGAFTAAYENHIKKLSESRYATYLSFVAALVLTGLLVLNGAFAFLPGSSLAFIQLSLNNTMLPICFAWIVGSSVHQSNWFTRALTAPPLLFCGMISYSLYLWQQMFTAPPSLYIYNSVIPVFPMMFVVATLSFYLIERPCVQLGRRLLSKRAVPRAIPRAHKHGHPQRFDDSSLRELTKR